MAGMKDKYILLACLQVLIQIYIRFCCDVRTIYSQVGSRRVKTEDKTIMSAAAMPSNSPLSDKTLSQIKQTLLTRNPMTQLLGPVWVAIKRPHRIS